MRVLFYGGCHAQALRRIFDTYGTGPGDSFDHIVNFTLIDSGEPFPYDRLAGFDLVVFSPIVNKDAYNTAHLLAFCQQHGIRTISFPWLEWHGYFAGAMKGQSFLGAATWIYPPLYAAARAAGSAGTFLDHMYGDTPLSLQGQIRAAMDRTTQTLIAAELRARVDIPVSAFIHRHYRTQRLFLTPDHPAVPLYRMVVERLQALTGLRLDPAFHYTAQEPQAGLKIPLLPAVYRALRLEFRDSDFQFALGMGERTMTLSEYLTAVYHHACNRQTFRARAATFLKDRLQQSSDLAAEEKTPVHKDDVLVGMIEADDGAHLRVQVISMNGRDLAAQRSVFLYKPAWEAMGAPAA